MGLSAIALRTQVLCIEDVLELLVSVQRTVCEQLLVAVRTVSGFATDSSLSRLGVVDLAALQNWRVQIGWAFAVIIDIERASVRSAMTLRVSSNTFAYAWVEVDPDLTRVLVKSLALAFL